MTRGRKVVVGLLLGLAILIPAKPAHGLITRLTPLKNVVEESEFILTAKVESVDADKPLMVLAVDEPLKGKVPFKKLTVHLKGDAEANKGKQTPDLLKRVAPKLPLVLFVNQRETTFIAFAYSNGTWFQMTGVKDDDSDAVRWGFTHLEPYLRRTYKGATADLQKAVADYLNDKKALPDTDPKEKPGLGPEVEPEKKQDKPEKANAGGRVTTGPVFAVIPAVLIGGPLALLAMLFPSAFGGWKRWLTLLSVGCTNTTLYSLQYYFPPDPPSVLGSSFALWIAMAVVTLAGVVWAFQRHYGRVMEGEAPFAPNLTELIVLSVVSLIGIGFVVYVRINHTSLLAPQWKPMLPYCVAAWGAVAYVAYARFVPRRLPALATEVVMLSIMAFATTALLATDYRAAYSVRGPDAGEAQPQIVWQFTATKGSLFSTPLVAGDRVYVGIAHDAVFSPYGTMYCLDRATGKEVWHFDDKKSMKQLYSTPCLHDGKLYLGEGLHQDFGCKVYCIKADTGEKVWDFATESHTESSPCVADGKVYCGAGDDGLYCLDAATGKKLWNFPGYHIDTSPVVVGKRVFAGAGVGDIYKEPAILCLNAETGEKEWLIKTDMPAWGSPTVADELVYFGLGNGRVNERDANPAGALLCVRAADGSEAWRLKTGDSVLCKPAVDAFHVYFGSSDNKLYCVNRRNGKACWQQDLGSPVVASPLLVPCTCSDAPSRVVALGSAGQEAMLDATTGRVAWSRNLAEEMKSEVEMFSTPVLEETTQGGGPRPLYIGATIVSTARTAVLYCYESKTEAGKD